jgi:hypothetical protein
MRIAICLSICLAVAAPAKAEIIVGYTAEWLSHESSLVATARPVEVENIKGPGDVWFTKTRFMLDEVIKGPQSEGDSITIFDFSHKKADVLGLDKARDESRQLLVFAIIAEHSFESIDGKYILARTRRFKSAYYTDQPVTGLFTTDFKLLTKFDELLDRARKQTACEADLKRQYWTGAIEKNSLEVPFDTEAYYHLYAGSGCYLWVPEYKEEKQKGNKTEVGDDK